MILNKNGLIIQDLERKLETHQNKPYWGIAAYKTEPLYPWQDIDEVSRHLSKSIFSLVNNHYNVDENGREHYTLDVIPTYDLSSRYIKHCQYLELPIRLLFVESTFYDPIWEGPLFPMNFLGYEMGSSEIGDPTMIYEIANCVHPEFQKFQNKINQNGLFDDFETISEYVDIRNRLLSEGIDIENDNPFYIMKISEININNFHL